MSFVTIIISVFIFIIGFLAGLGYGIRRSLKEDDYDWDDEDDSGHDEL